jgi:hypothetical protein
MSAILFSANPKQCDMNDAVDHLKTHSKLYFEVKFRIRKSSFHEFPVDGFVHISGTNEVQYVARIVDVVPFSKSHYEKPELYGGVKPSKWIKEWQENKNDIQSEPWKYALVITMIEPVALKLSWFRNSRGERASAIRTYARVIPPEGWATSQVETLVADLKSIEKQNDLDPTTKEALINARVGQGKFRAQVLQLWDDCCAVTGSMTQAAIRASHIKPWRESSDAERLDPNNGLPLIASLDALFDAGLISFDASGTLMTSPTLSTTERAIFGIRERSLRKKPTGKTTGYLANHRAKHGFES